jgi:hypothetical protein
MYEFGHDEKSKDTVLVNTLMEKYSINFMDLRCVQSGTCHEYSLKGDFFKYDPKTREWDKMMPKFSSWESQYEHLEKSKDTEMVESLKSTFGYSFIDDIRMVERYPKTEEFYLISDKNTYLKYENKIWIKPVVKDKISLGVKYIGGTKKVKNISYGTMCFESYPCQHYFYEEYEDGTIERLGLLCASVICEKFKDYGIEIPEHFKDYET